MKRSLAVPIVDFPVRLVYFFPQKVFHKKRKLFDLCILNNFMYSYDKKYIFHKI